MDYKKITVYSNPEAEELLIAAFLAENALGTQVEGGELPDVSGFDYLDENDLGDTDFSVSAYFPININTTEKLSCIEERISAFKRNVPEIEFGETRIEVDDVFEKDWANEWKKYFHTKKVSDFVVIKPSWEEYAPAEDEVVVELDPGMAFGTGTHESTRMCIEFIEEYMEQDANVLDVGCGSGILSIASAKLGASSVLALDLDPVAVDVAKKNADINGVSDKVNVISSDITAGVPRKKEYDIVLANIIADVIIRLNDDITDFIKRPGIYICSGIIKERLNDVIESLKKHKFRIIEIREDGEWCAVACKNHL